MHSADCTKRHYIRHATEVPIEVSADSAQHPRTRTGRNISYGGLAFSSRQALPVGQLIHLTIPLGDPAFSTRARVAWCHPTGPDYEIGVEFLTREAAFRVRMVEQVCQIEQYRKEMREKFGRELTTQEAALAWIKKFAADFFTTE